MRIQTNTVSLSIWSSYSDNLSKMQASMGRLSTGLISSSDDPAAVGVGERMTTQLNDIERARQNTDNSISLVQTADGWLSDITDILSRMEELAVEANGGLLGDTDLENVQAEYEELQEEIVRITSDTNAAGTFNGVYLFQGGSLTVQIGESTDQTIDINLSNISTSSTDTVGTVSSYSYDSSGTVIGSTHTTVAWTSIIDTSMTSVGTDDLSEMISLAIDYISNARAQLAAQQTRLEYTDSSLLTYQDNLNAAQSDIMDIDMALETTEYTTYEILTEVANAMLAQANQLPGQVLDQLQG